MKLLPILLISIVLVACGGGEDPFASLPGPLIKATVPTPIKKATTVTGGNAVVIHLYQALYGMAPSNALLLDYAFQAANDASFFAKNLTDRFALTSHAELAKLVLDNLGVTGDTVPAINASGHGEYVILLDAVTQIFGAFPTMRGQVLLNMTNLLAGLESDATYGAAALAYNNQASSNFSYSINPTSQVSTAVAPPNPPIDGSGGGGMASVKASISISDPISYYSHACQNPNISFVIPVDINHDGKDDFLVHYWCSLELPWGRSITTVTPDALVVQLSQPDGTYRVANVEVFGQALYGLGGASRKYVRSDINGDGRDDFVFAMNWEDGRSGNDPITNATQPSVLISAPNDGYRLIRLGNANWGHSVDVVKNASGTIDVLFAGFVRSLQAFRYVNGQFQDVSGEYPSSLTNSWASSFRSVKSAETGVTQYIAAAATKQDYSQSQYAVAAQGIQLFSKTSAGVLQLVSEHWNNVDFTVDWISWQQSKGTNSIMTFNGKQYFGGAFAEMCVMAPLKSDGARLIVAKFSASSDISGRTIVAGQTYSENDTRPVNIYVFYELSSNGLKLIDSPIVNEEQVSNFNFFDCKDINQDGLPDLVSYAYTRPGFNERVAEAGKPTIYLNNGNESLVKMDISSLPGLSIGNEKQSTLSDVNGDGVIDMLLFGSSTYSGGGQIEIELLSKALTVR